MVSEDAVRWAYRLILGREPESEALIRIFAANVDSIGSLRKELMQSDEFCGLTGFRLRTPNRYAADLEGTPRIFIISNCQGPEIAKHLASVTSLPVIGREVTAYYEAEVGEWYAECDRADIILAASLSEHFNGIQLHQLHERYPGKVHSIMPPFFEELFPDITALGVINRRIDGPMALHSKLILRSFLLGEPAARCAEKFDLPTFERFGYLGAWDRSADEFHRRDQAADVRIGERFFANLYDTPLLMTNNHPTPALYRLICESIVEYFGLTMTDMPLISIPCAQAFTPTFPIHDIVAERFGLRYRTPQLYTREFVSWNIAGFAEASYAYYGTLDRDVLKAAIRQRDPAMFSDIG